MVDLLLIMFVKILIEIWVNILGTLSNDSMNL